MVGGGRGFRRQWPIASAWAGLVAVDFSTGVLGTPFGAFVQLSPSVEALVHVSEMSDDEAVDPEQLFQLNEKKEFKVLDIDTENRKIALSLKEAKTKSKAKVTKAKSEK